MDTNKEPKNIDIGVVYKKMIGTYHVRANEHIVPCSISSKLRRELIYPIAAPSSIRPHVVDVKDIGSVDPVAIGDRVKYIDAGDGTGMIIEVLPRKNKLVRPDLDSSRRTPEAKLLEQVIVANIDQVIPVFSIAQPKPKWDLLDRYLISAESLQLSALICITKMDLVGYAGKELMDALYEFEKIGYQVLWTSVRSRVGIQELKDAIKDKTSVFIGKSGVGKTSLLNVIQPGLGLRVNEVSQATGKGKHTTTHLEMFALDSGGDVVDTPGMREFGLWQVDNTNLAYLFLEMQPYIGKCKFGLDCSHTHEPSCAVKSAHENGKISTRRYNSYVKMLK